jgi:transposase
MAGHRANQHQIDLVGPMVSDPSWQAKAGQGYDLAHFQIDGDAHTVTGPQGHTARQWAPTPDARGHPVTSVTFSQTDCRACVARALCTHAETQPRDWTLVRLPLRGLECQPPAAAKSVDRE